MPQTTKFFFYLVVISQTLLNVTFINSAVIRREQRSLTTNGTVSAEIDDRDFEPETSIGLEDDGNLLLEMPSFKDDTTTKNSIQDTVITTSAFGEEKKEDTTLTGLRLDENTVGLSLENEEKSSKVVKIQDENKTVSAASKNEESTTEEMADKSTITKFEETTTIIPSVIENDRTTSKKEEEVSTASTITKIEETTTIIPSVIENDRTTSKKEEEVSTASAITKIEETTTIIPLVIENDRTTFKKEEAEVSTGSIETATQLEVESNVGHSNDKTKKEDKIGTTVENSSHTSEDTTRVMSTALEETTKVSARNTTLDETTSTEVPTTTIPVENDSATKSETLQTNVKLEEVDKVTEPLHVQKELVVTSTELADNDISKTFAPNEHKANLMDEKEVVTTESVLLAKDQNMEKQKMSNDTLFTKAIETTQPPTSTEEFSEQDAITTVVLDEDLKKLGNDVKPSNSSSTEKRGKFIANNYSSFNDFHLPNTSDVWALAGLRSVGKAKSSELQNSVETSEEKPSVNNSMVATKSLHDWTRVMDNTHDMESKPFMKIVENTEDPTTETATSIMETTHGTTPSTTVKTGDVATDFTTEMPVQLETTETRVNQDNEVELSTAKVETEPTTVPAVSLKDKFESEIIANPTESQNTNNDLETTTDKYEQADIATTDANPPKNTDDIISTTTTVSSIYGLANHEKTIEENKVDGDSFEKETISLPTTTTTTTTTTTMVAPIPQLVTVKSETTDSLANGEIIREANAGTTSLSTSSLSDFTTSIPFLTSTAAITKKTTMEVMTDVMTTTTPPVVILNTDYEVNEPSSSTAPSKIPMQTTSPAAVTIDSSAATPTTRATTTTTMPSAVTVIETLTEKQTTTTTEEPPTRAIISNDTMIQKSNNNNYNEYEVVNKSTENYADNSSTEAFEATTRVGLQSNWATNAAELPTTEVDKLDDDLDVTTVSTFENNNAYDIVSTTIKTTTVIGTVTLAPKTHPIVTDPATAIDGAKTSTENLDHIDPVHNISDTAETSIESNVIDPLQVGDTSTTATATATTTTTTTTESNQEHMKMPSTTTGSGDDDSIYSISTTTTKMSTTTTTSTPNLNYDESATTFESISTKKEDVYSIVPTTIDIGGGGGYNVPKSVLDDYTTTTLMPPGDLGVGTGIIGGGDGLQPMDSPDAQETDVNVIIAISVSTVGIIALILLVAFLYVMRKRQKQMSYGQRCRPVSLDAYSLDNVSVYNSVRRKGATLRASKRSYGNVAFDDPSLRHNVLGTHELARYVEKKSSIFDEFKEVPQIIARADEVPAGCEDKNRYANVIPLPETRVILQQQNGDEKSEYINANYVRGPKDTTNYYIACQAPLETTVNDFWRMIWEQNSRVIIMATDLIENGIDKCAEYLPPSVTLDNHTVFGDYQVTLKHREVKEKYAISTLMLKNTVNDESREITHYWYQWPEAGVPTDEAAIIAMLLEARSSLKAYTIEQWDSKIENATVEDDSSSATKIEINGNVTAEKPKPPAKDQGPLTIHCSPGTGRTGTILACDIAMRCLEEPKRTVDIPQTVYSVRRGRASAVQTKEQYEFIYKVTHMYATKISNINNDN